MRNLHELDQYRLTDQRIVGFFGDAGDGENGVFIVLSPIDKAMLRIIASSGLGWDHVSVSRSTRAPNWSEMSHVAQLFFKDDETAMQMHVPREDHVNDHPYTLHWWRPHTVEIPRPPRFMIGGMSLDEAHDEAVAYAEKTGSPL